MPASCSAVIHARHFGLGAFLEAHGQALGDGQANQIGQVEFLLGIVVAKGAE